MIIIGRKSRNTDQALIKAGIELIAQGNYDPTVRAICTLANVNQGMFVYYFGFKEEYMKVLFQKIYPIRTLFYYSPETDIWQCVFKGDFISLHIFVPV